MTEKHVTVADAADYLEKHPDIAGQAIQQSGIYGIATGTIKCIRCGTMFKPPAWCFYDLCDSCFEIFEHDRNENALMTHRASRYLRQMNGAIPWAQENPVDVKIDEMKKACRQRSCQKCTCEGAVRDFFY